MKIEATEDRRGVEIVRFEEEFPLMDYELGMRSLSNDSIEHRLAQYRKEFYMYLIENGEEIEL